MAKNSTPSNVMPIDRPIEIAPGVTHRMTDFQGNAKFGFAQSTFGDSVEGRLKGNLDNNWGLPPRALDSSGSPFANMKEGK